MEEQQKHKIFKGGFCIVIDDSYMRGAVELGEQLTQNCEGKQEAFDRSKVYELLREIYPRCGS